ncbi:MAG: HEAT repeat domain-containing protein, partial [Bacteroidales bacterium]|nr:HEAT repeat domain-containing protein [Bacteroidales bacterium]
SFAGKQHVCRELSIIGTAESVPVLSMMLTEKGMTETALLALEKIPGSQAGHAMLAGLEAGDVKMKIAIVNSLASRKVDDAVEPLIKLMHSPNKQLAHSSINALGTFGGERAAKALDNFSYESDPSLKVSVLDAQLRCANQFLEANDIRNARIIYEQVYRTDPIYPLKYNALLGMFNTSSEDPVNFIANYLRKEEPGFHPYIIRLIYQSDETENLDILLKDLPDLPTASRIHLISAVAAKGDLSFRKKILEATSEEIQDVRTAAIRALGYIGKPEDVIFLAKLANEKRGTEQELARQSLSILRGTGVNESIIGGISESEAGIKAELIRCTGERNITEAINLLFETASDADKTVRRESIGALGKLAPSEKIPEMISLLISSPNRRERQEAERAVFALIQKMPEASDRSAAILESLTGLDDPAALASLISILGMIGDNKDLDVLRGYLNSDDGLVQIAALKALSGWQNAAPMND